MPKKELDHSDILILNILQKEGSISNKDLSKRIGLAQATTLQRVLKLKKLELISNCQYELNKPLIGYTLCYFLKLFVNNQEAFKEKLNSILLRDSRIESIFISQSEASPGVLIYRIMFWVKEKADLDDWTKNLVETEKLPVIIEKELVQEILKHRSHLKLTYKDLPELRKL